MSEVTRKEIAEVFKTTRETFGISQLDVSHNGAICQSTVSRIERGGYIRKGSLIASFHGLLGAVRKKIAEVEIKNEKT